MTTGREVHLMVTDGMRQRQVVSGDQVKEFFGNTVPMFNARLFQMDNIAAKSAVSVAAAFAGNAASNTIALETSPNPAYPRNLRVVIAASYDGGNVTVTGTNQFDEVITEVFTGTASSTQVGLKVFKTVTGAVKAAVGVNAATATIGTGDTLGLTTRIASAFGMLMLAGVSEAVTVGTTYSSFIPTTVPNGTVDYTLLVNV